MAPQRHSSANQALDTGKGRGQEWTNHDTGTSKEFQEEQATRLARRHSWKVGQAYGWYNGIPGRVDRRHRWRDDATVFFEVWTSSWLAQLNSWKSDGATGLPARSALANKRSRIRAARVQTEPSIRRGNRPPTSGKALAFWKHSSRSRADARKPPGRPPVVKPGDGK